jgi:hypothetical protein
MRPRTLTTLTVAALALLAGCVGAASPTALTDGGASQSVNATETPGISVSSSATVEAAPDLAVVRVAVEAEADTADEARAQVADATERMRTALRDAGIDDENVTTEAFNVYLQYDYRNEEREPDGYRAVHAYRIEVAPDRAGEVIDAAVGSGATQVSGVQFTLSDDRRQDLREEALVLAVENARADAEAVAGAAGVSVGSVQSISTSSDFGPVYPFAEARASDAGGSTVVEPGPVSVTASVNVVYGVA